MPIRWCSWRRIKKAIVQYREVITEGDIGDPTPDFPANPAFALPVVQPTGIFERLNNLVERIRVAPNYTPETGALLGIIPTASESIAPADVKPLIQVFAAQTGYEFSVVAENREKADSWSVQDSPRRTGKMGNGQNRDRQIGQCRHHANHARQTRTTPDSRAVVKKQRKLRSTFRCGFRNRQPVNLKRKPEQTGARASLPASFYLFQVYFFTHAGRDARAPIII